MNARIREYAPPDGERVVELSLRAWAPVFYQERAVRDVLASASKLLWFAETGRGVVGFVAATLDGGRRIPRPPTRRSAADPTSW